MEVPSRLVEERGKASTHKSRLPPPEYSLARRDPVLARVISEQSARWPEQPTEDPIWGLIRIVVAQQVATSVACELARRMKCTYPSLGSTALIVPTVAALRDLGLSTARAQCCVHIAENSAAILANVRSGESWEQALRDVKGIGPWTISVFRIMVLRDTDVLPTGDVGLCRAVANLYGECQLSLLSDQWRPFRSVACWYLWRTLGNQQLG
jgi:DNA-3-methyladenine glycosylase II